MDHRLWNAFMKVIDKHYAVVQTDTMLEHTDNWKLEKKAKQFRADFEAASEEFKALLGQYVMSPTGARDEGEEGRRGTLANELERLCCAETEGAFFDCVTDNIQTILVALRAGAQVIGALELEVESRPPQSRALNSPSTGSK